MEFHEKLQELRKQKGITQEQLAQMLSVSRTAISKWESGRGYPNIDSLVAIAKFYSVTVDELLSGDEILTIAQENEKKQRSYLNDLLLGILDISALVLLFLPFFGQKDGDFIRSVSLLSFSESQLWLRVAFGICIAATALWGVLTLALQNCVNVFWVKSKSNISLILSGLSTLLFILCRQTYAAVYLFLFLLIKLLVLIKSR